MVRLIQGDVLTLKGIKGERRFLGYHPLNNKYVGISIKNMNDDAMHEKQIHHIEVVLDRLKTATRDGVQVFPERKGEFIPGFRNHTKQLNRLFV